MTRGRAALLRRVADDVGARGNVEAEEIGASVCGLRSIDVNASDVIWPNASVSSIARGSLSRKPMRTRVNCESAALGDRVDVFESVGRRAGRQREVARRASLSPASSAAGVAPSAASSLRTMTWFRSLS